MAGSKGQKMAENQEKLNGCIGRVREKSLIRSGYFSHTFTGCNKLAGKGIEWYRFKVAREHGL
jgi:hypothetical protein